ncbi:hypothetical protein SAMN04487995_3230 [Dyadobacter koreensis]|uniref:DUF5672 domain-containing protein n=1 Tax=Dyadobacter koreensis TaxID=408657 RepID=A0A1H6W0G2_9BACT|nr:DUF5672 family protein [Dyadobacter koreensis]SEJ10429.1 hypothetical protein SAMN04487995_3230 [Dyadobacter koreensis]
MKIQKQEPGVAIVIPVYKLELTESEKLSLRQCLKVLSRYPVIFVKPDGLDFAEIKQEYPSISFKSFEDHYFKGIDSYNRLMISTDFYKAFSDFEYILIYQLDAYVFRDELTEWCRKDYDYVGAPSLHQEEFDTLSSDQQDIFAKALSGNRIVLNGGLSLRKVSAFLRYLKIYNTFYPAWLGNEDMLFSQEATRLIPMKLFLKLPPWKEALRFSFEKSPAATYEITNHELPFACHAWERYDPEFWSAFIPQK